MASGENGKMTSREEIIAKFRETAQRASFNFAGDRSERHLGMALEEQCQKIYDAADDDLKAELYGIKGQYLIMIIKAPDASKAVA